jgi:hypothetical protein
MHIHLAILALSFANVTPEAPLPELEPFLANVRLHLKTDRELLSQYTYHQRSRDLRLTLTGKLVPGPEKLFEVYPGVGRGEYHRLIAVDGKARDPKELAAADERRRAHVLDAVARRGRESASDRDKRLRLEAAKEREREERIADVFRICDFKLVAREPLAGRSAIVLDFAPRPGAVAKTDDGKILKKTKGRAWVSEDDYALARLNVEMIDDIPLGAFLFKLHKGTTLSFERKKVNDEVWLPAQTRLTLAGRALFRKFRVETVIEYSDYRKFGVETEETFQGAH